MREPEQNAAARSDLSGPAGHEEVLTGGNTTAVTKVGDTVRRAAGPWSPTIHALLRHLRCQGLTWVPEPDGFADDGREILSHLPGTAPQDPMPAWVWDDDTLVQATRRLRELHDATAGLEMTDSTWWIDAHTPREVVCHNDFAPYNFVFDAAHRLTGVIDWDTASPGPRVWDAAYLAYRLVPLSAPGNPDLLASDLPERRRRLRLLTDTYGARAEDEGGNLDGVGLDLAALLDTADLLETAVRRVLDLADFTERRADEGAEQVRAHVHGYRADARWLAEHRAALAGETDDQVG